MSKALRQTDGFPIVRNGEMEGLTLAEASAFASGCREIEYRADMEVLEQGNGLPDEFCDAHPDVQSVTATCDPILGNVMVAGLMDNPTDSPTTHASYDAESDVLSIYCNRTAFCCEPSTGEGLLASSADVFSWVKVSWTDDGVPIVVRESLPTAEKACSRAESTIVGGKKDALGSIVANNGPARALALMVVTAMVVSVAVGETVVTLARKDAIAGAGPLTQARYVHKHVIADYGGAEQAESAEPGIVESVFSDTKMRGWSFTYAPSEVWGGAILVDGKTTVYED